MMIAQRFDIAIIGAGLAGSALAAALGNSRWRVALIEAQPLSLQWPTLGDGINDFDLRVSALTAASQDFLDQLVFEGKSVWRDVSARRVSAYRHMQVWDGDGTGAIHFDADEVNRGELGHIVENTILQAALLHGVSACRNVQIFSGNAVEQFTRTSLSQNQSGIEIALSNGATLHTTLLVGADGSNSRVRAWAQFATREWDYGHTAIVATIQTEKPHAQTARQIFRREGPLAFLPLRTTQGDEHYCSIVWSTLPEEAQALMAMDDAQFMQALGRAFEFTLGEITATSRRVAFPLRARHVNEYTQANIALIGDAAHTIHPLAGQGINLGFLDAQALARELLRAEQRGLSAADTDVLARYQRERKSDNVATLAAMEGFKRLFAANALPVRWLRNTGLKFFDRSGPLKRLMIRQAMGIAL
ncbi:MAG: UbiH/UbiF/VisC/COQ6 family ubiquinone biosynthesis hydroxylase [Spongiibacteraceae bacterium]